MDSSTDHNSLRGSSPRLCVRGCGFFETAESHGLCSKCYDDSFRAKTVKSSEPAAVTGERTHQSCKIKISTEKDSSSNSATSIDDEAVKPSPISSGKNRCGLCRKKIGVLGFRCRCGGNFCGTHRYPEVHSCRIDFKKAGKIVIGMENPVCKADKMKDRI